MALDNGILYQTSIVFGQKNHMVHIDTREKFVENDYDTKAVEHIQTTYQKHHPEVTNQAVFYLIQSADGIRFL